MHVEWNHCNHCLDSSSIHSKRHFGVISYRYIFSFSSENVCDLFLTKSRHLIRFILFNRVSTTSYFLWWCHPVLRGCISWMWISEFDRISIRRLPRFISKKKTVWKTGLLRADRVLVKVTTYQQQWFQTIQLVTVSVSYFLHIQEPWICLFSLIWTSTVRHWPCPLNKHFSHQILITYI